MGVAESNLIRIPHFWCQIAPRLVVEWFYCDIKMKPDPRILTITVAAAAISMFSAVTVAKQSDSTFPGASPARKIERDGRTRRKPIKSEPVFRNIDGTDNNRSDPEMNATLSILGRLMPPDYSDDIGQMAGANRPNPRAISNTIAAQNDSVLNAKGVSDFFWQWGQFIDHDIDLTDGSTPPEAAHIRVPAGDPFFDPDQTGSAVILFNRSVYHPDTGLSVESPRDQLNEITGWFDASNVYGSEHGRATALRTNDGTGQLKTSAGGLLPFNIDGLPNAGGSSAALFLAGDVRANEQVALTAMHTLFVREHNRLAKSIAAKYPHLGGEELYQRARRIVGAQLQVITYNEFVPQLLGRRALRRYRGYRPNVDASIMNAFSTAAFRLGHSLLSPQIRRLNADGSSIDDGDLALRQAFFAPGELTKGGGIEPVLRGLASQVCQELDHLVIDDVRNFLFGQPGAGGFDLAALNIQRGRDHGVPSYNDTRAALGLGRIDSFKQISSDRATQRKLSQAYATVDDVDLWVGGLAEDHFRDAMVGETFFVILKTQFETLRDGDRFWFENYFRGRELAELRRTRLADIIRRNTKIGREIQDDVFRAPRQRHRRKHHAN